MTNEITSPATNAAASHRDRDLSISRPTRGGPRGSATSPTPNAMEIDRIGGRCSPSCAAARTGGHRPSGRRRHNSAATSVRDLALCDDLADPLGQQVELLAGQLHGYRYRHLATGRGDGQFPPTTMGVGGASCPARRRTARMRASSWSPPNGLTGSRRRRGRGLERSPSRRREPLRRPRAPSSRRATSTARSGRRRQQPGQRRHPEAGRRPPCSRPCRSAQLVTAWRARPDCATTRRGSRDHLRRRAREPWGYATRSVEEPMSGSRAQLLRYAATWVLVVSVTAGLSWGAISRAGEAATLLGAPVPLGSAAAPTDDRRLDAARPSRSRPRRR